MLSSLTPLCLRVLTRYCAYPYAYVYSYDDLLLSLSITSKYAYAWVSAYILMHTYVTKET